MDESTVTSTTTTTTTNTTLTTTIAPTNPNTFFQPNNNSFERIQNTPDNAIIAKVEAELTILSLDFDQEELGIMRKKYFLREEEEKYQIQGEPLGRESILIMEYLEEAKKLGSTEINKEKLKLLYLKEYEKLREDMIANQKTWLESNGKCSQYYDKESDKLFLSTQDSFKLLLNNYIKKLDIGLSTHKENFMNTLTSLTSLSELSAYQNKLSQTHIDINKRIDKILEVKESLDMQFGDNRAAFVYNKKNTLGLALLEAVKANDIPVCQYLIKANADISFQNEEGFSVLHLAPDVNMMQWLFSQGAKLDLSLNYTDPRDHRGFTPLHWHTFMGNIDIVKFLLEAGADVNARSKQKVTPLFLATKTNPNPEIVKILIDYGANIRAKNEKGHFAMGTASSHKNDKFKDMSSLTEELLGEQAGKGMQAWHIVQKQKIQLAKMEERQLEFQRLLNDLKEENTLLKKQIALLQKNTVNKESPEKSSDAGDNNAPDVNHNKGGPSQKFF